MAKKLWGGRFKKKTDPLVEDFTKSIDYDYKLAWCDVFGSIIHINILRKSNFLELEEAEKLGKALQKIGENIENFKYDKNCEDIHTAIQNELEKEVGDLVLKLHTARSRNDQVVFALKMFCKAELEKIVALCKELKESLSEISKKVKEEKIVIPGYTHLQHAQLIYLSDYLLSYAEMIGRDSLRLKNTHDRINLTLGAGALAGTPISASVYTQAVKSHLEESDILKKLNVKGSYELSSSLDAVSDRDFVIESLSSLSILGMHLSRLAEDLILWSTKEFGFVELDDAFATGSSLMPQKKNPDVLELIRGYTGTLYGNLMSVLTMMKGLPLSYNRDMQLDKPPLFNSFEIIEKELKILPKLIETLKWNKENIEKAIQEESLYATDLVYYLIEKGMPFKTAHDTIGKLVSHSLETGKKIKEMSDKELKQFSDKLKQSEIVKLMNPIVSVESRVSIDRSGRK